MKIGMRSLYVRILLASLGTLLLSFVGFVLLSRTISSQTSDRFLLSVISFENQHSRRIYERDGPDALKQFLVELDGALGATHYFTDGRGRDLVSGEDRSGLLPGPREEFRSRKIGDHKILAKPSDDGRYYFIVVAPDQAWLSVWTFAPYFVLILAAVAVLCWVLAIGVAYPIRQVAEAVNRFGAGDLSTRVTLERKDEIGELAQSFNEMADRTETLLNSERRLLQDISHELRSPLARLSFGIELARTAEDREAAMNRLKRELARLTSLVGALLEVTRAEGDPRSRVLDSVRLDHVVREVVEDCALDAQARECRLGTVEPVPIVLPGDRELLRRAIENILRNAIRFAPTGTEVEVTVASNSSKAEIVVRDYGPGVPDDALPRIFDPFFRVDDSRNASTGGIGLGLAIANRAIQLHHGRLAAENAHPGLRVRIEVPLTAEIAAR